ncbi:HAD-IIB family hydrolase [Deinococcus sp.]|uniref:HAD-IIB family hydrolase n=1 Tax=Deinococcus sp. TaxID=47478 RepID=UPI0025BC10CC|nr:HAD family hydrolase [Deinococcus sp.]
MTVPPPALPPFEPLLLAFDLDGTLLADGGVHMPPDTAAALGRLRALGVKFAIVTGRDTPPAPVRQQMQPDVIATNNGGRVEVGGTLHRSATFDVADLRAVLAHELKDARTVLFTRDHLYVDLPAGRDPEPWMVARSYRPIEEAPEEGILKVGFYHPEVAGHAGKLRTSHPHLVLTGGQEPYPYFLTVTPTGADKAAALALAAEALGIALERTVAFGDSDNDEVMLEVAGFAVQVGTLPLLEPHADAQLPSHLELGAYLAALADRLERA